YGSRRAGAREPLQGLMGRRNGDARADIERAVAGGRGALEHDVTVIVEADAIQVAPIRSYRSATVSSRAFCCVTASGSATTLPMGISAVRAGSTRSECEVGAVGHRRPLLVATTSIGSTRIAAGKHGSQLPPGNRL